MVFSLYCLSVFNQLHSLSSSTLFRVEFLCWFIFALLSFLPGLHSWKISPWEGHKWSGPVLISKRNHANNWLIAFIKRTKLPCILVYSDCHGKTPQTGGLKNRNLLPHGTGGWKFKIKVLAGLISSEVSLFGLQAIFSLWPCIVFPLYMYLLGVSLCAHIFS